MLVMIEAFSSERPEAKPINTYINPQLIASIRPRVDVRRDENGASRVNVHEEWSVVSMAGDSSGAGWLVKRTARELIDDLLLSPAAEYERKAEVA